MTKIRDLVGQRFNDWTVVGFSHIDRQGGYWRCVCVCGKSKIVRGINLTHGYSKSCGCLTAKVAKEFHTKKHKTVNGVELKECSICRIYKPLENFYKNRRLWDGVDGRCRTCESKRRASQDRERKNTNWNEQYRNKYSKNIDFVIKKRLSARIRKVIRGINKSKRTMELVGCSIEFFKNRIESMFINGMTWENCGTAWHIDHIKPCAAFDLSDPEQQKQCFHYTNLQPMFAKDNLSKNSLYKGILHRKATT